jgi:diguanylate cyclase (GGDEF)-like protein
MLTTLGGTAAGVARTWLPRGQTLPEEAWRARHRAVVALLLLHAAAFAAYGVTAGFSVVHLLLDAAVPTIGAVAASLTFLGRGARSAVGAISTMLTSGVVVHLMDGAIEGHFHFFVMIPVIALYEDWMPFGLGVGVVLVHHGVVGTLSPHGVYNHASAVEQPWLWAAVHAGFFAAGCVGALLNWKLHETARTAEQSLLRRVRHQAQHDSLTGLPNRAQMLEYAEALSSDPRYRAPVAVLLIDLDRFKEVNDVLGHASGDVLLNMVGPLMGAAVREGDIFCRLGGDEFAAVLRDADEQTALSVAKRLLELICVPMEIDGVVLDVEASVGIAVAPSLQDVDIDALLRRADIAMYTAKRSRCGFMLYRADQDTSTLERLSLLAEMRQALQKEDEFVLHYQPKVALPDQRLIGVEALARWQHPTRGLLGPAEFIPIAESTGLIVPFTLHVIRLALSHFHQWQTGDESFSIAVNLSPRCLGETELTTKVLALLTEYGVPPRMLELEITENTLAHDPDRALATLTALHNAGVRISIDDFGTGYSSMSYLKRLPVSELKVDRSFVMGMLNAADDDVLVRSVIDLGHNLGLTVVAEGVEDQATLEALHLAGCDVVQGYHTGRPMTLEALKAWRASRSGAVQS